MLQHLPLRGPREALREPREGSGSSITPGKAQETFWPVPAQPGLELGLQIAVELAIGLGPARPQIAGHQLLKRLLLHLSWHLL